VSRPRFVCSLFVHRSQKIGAFTLIGTGMEQQRWFAKTLISKSGGYAMDRNEEPRTVVPTSEARQGVTGHNVRYVLTVGVAAIVVIFAGLWLYYFA
jgi:hypothetical protein